MAEKYPQLTKVNLQPYLYLLSVKYLPRFFEIIERNSIKIEFLCLIRITKQRWLTRLWKERIFHFASVFRGFILFLYLLQLPWGENWNSSLNVISCSYILYMRWKNKGEILFPIFKKSQSSMNSDFLRESVTKLGLGNTVRIMLLIQVIEILMSIPHLANDKGDFKREVILCLACIHKQNARTDQIWAHT